MDKQLESIVLGAGCFWCVEAVFQDLKGVVSVESGYSNGPSSERPSYEYVCSGTSGYVEVLKVVFDPSEVSLETILDVFWHTHNPTTLNRQGNDRGSQYRSGIYYEGDAQKQIAIESKEVIESAGIYLDPIVTEIEQLVHYYPAEAYHQEFYNRVGNQNSYCTYVISPKVAKFRARYKDLLK